MIQLEELRTSLLNNKDEMTELRGALDLENGAQEAAELEKQTAAPGFWDAPEQSQKVLQRIKQLKDKAARYEKLEGLYQDTLELIDLALEEGDEGLYAEVQKDYDRFQAMGSLKSNTPSLGSWRFQTVYVSTVLKPNAFKLYKDRYHCSRGIRK